MKVKAIVFTGVNQVALQPVEIPAPGAGEVLLEAHYTLVRSSLLPLQSGERPSMMVLSAVAPLWT